MTARWSLRRAAPGGGWDNGALRPAASQLTTTRAEFWLEVLKGTILECRNVWRAKRGHDPYGMLLKDRPWPEIWRRTWSARRDWIIWRNDNPQYFR